MPGCRDGTWRPGMHCRSRHVGNLLSDGTRAALIMIGSVRIRLPSGRFLADSGSKEHFGILAGQAETKNRGVGETENRKKLRNWEVEKRKG
jgi:hypothetical protein